MSKDNNEINEFSNRLMTDLEKKTKDVEVFSEADPMLALRGDILTFFRTIMTSVSKK